MSDFSRRFLPHNFTNNTNPALAADALNYTEGFISELDDRTRLLHDTSASAEEVGGLWDHATKAVSDSILYARRASDSAVGAESAMRIAETHSRQASSASQAASKSAENASGSASEASLYSSTAKAEATQAVDAARIAINSADRAEAAAVGIDTYADRAEAAATSAEESAERAMSGTPEGYAQLVADVEEIKQHGAHKTPMLTKAQYDTLIAEGSVIVGEETVTYDPQGEYDVAESTEEEILAQNVKYGTSNVQSALDGVQSALNSKADISKTICETNITLVDFSDEKILALDSGVYMFANNSFSQYGFPIGWGVLVMLRTGLNYAVVVLFGTNGKMYFRNIMGEQFRETSWISVN